MKRISLLALVALLAAGLAFGQTASNAEEAKDLAFRAGLNLGTDVLPTGTGGANESWSRLGFQPDLAFGKIGVGLDLTFRFQLYPTQDEALRLYQGDWIPDAENNVFDIYLPKILYVRYGLKGADPLFAKLGSIDDLTLGNGWIMGGYSNMRFMPRTRIFGLNAGLDGALFNFPIVGAEFVVGNLAKFDVAGIRAYVRPLVTTGLPILENLQVGGSFVFDRAPHAYVDTAPVGSEATVSAWGLDLLQPILGSKALSLAAFADVAGLQNGAVGGMLGFGGKLIGFLTYGAQLRILGAGFIPAYFDQNYDLYRSAKAAYMSLDQSGKEGAAGWFASLGTSFLDDQVGFMAALDGPFKTIDAASTNQADFPHFRASARLAEGLIPSFFADASYEKYFLGKNKSFIGDLIDPTDAIIGLSLNYKTGASVLTLRYDVRYDPVGGDFVSSSSIQASLKL